MRTRATTLAAALLLAAAGAARAEDARPARLRLRLRETAGFTESDVSGQTRGRFRLDVSGRTDAKSLANFGVSCGELAFGVTLDRGRFTGDVEAAAGTVRVRVRSRGHELRATVSGRAARGAGTVLGARCLERGMYVGKGASFHGLTAASADVDGAAVPLVVGWTGWAVAKTRWDDGTSRYDVGLVAASVAPVPRATRPVVLLTPPRPGGRWNGRLSGIAFSTGAPPALSYGTSAGRARRIDVADETSEDFGDAETQSPGISLLVLPEGAVFERGFDLAVQFPPGPQTVTVRAEGRHGERAEASRDVLTPPEIPPDVLDADFHVLEVRDGGDLWAWGQNIAGVIGDGTYDRSPASPKPLAMPTDVVAVGAGSMYSIAADARGDVWVWGDIGDVDVSGGVVTDTYAPWPRRVDALDGIVAISAGYEDALALDASGGVWLWQYDTPHVREIRGAPPLAAVAAGETADVGLDLDGGVWHLDAKDAAGKRKPALLTGFPAASAVAGGEDEVLVLGTDGAVWQWTGAANAPVVRVTLPGRATAVSAGYYYSLALLEDGTVWAWSSSQETPQGIEGIRVRNLDGITSIVAGSGDKSFALDADGFLWMWPSFDLLGGEERPVLAPREYRPGGIPPARATLPKRPPRKR